jgi:hypothetical protein
MIDSSAETLNLLSARCSDVPQPHNIARGTINNIFSELFIILLQKEAHYL